MLLLKHEVMGWRSALVSHVQYIYSPVQSNLTQLSKCFGSDQMEAEVCGDNVLVEHNRVILCSKTNRFNHYR